MHVPLNPVVSGRFSFESSSSISIKSLDAPLELLAGVSLEEFGAGVSLDEVGAEVSLDEGAGLLEELGTGSLDGLETDSLSQLIQQRAALERSSFPKSL